MFSEIDDTSAIVGALFRANEMIPIYVTNTGAQELVYYDPYAGEAYMIGELAFTGDMLVLESADDAVEVLNVARALAGDEVIGCIPLKDGHNIFIFQIGNDTKLGTLTLSEVSNYRTLNLQDTDLNIEF